MPLIDTNLLVGPCPFRDIPSTPADLLLLKERARLDRAIAMGFRSLLYYDPIVGLEQDLDQYAALADWLYFYAVINPEFPLLEAQMRQAAEDERIAAIRILPALHHYSLHSKNTLQTLHLAARYDLPLNLMARIFDGRVAPRCIRQAEIPPSDLAPFLERTEGVTVILSMFFFSELELFDIDWTKLPNIYLDLGSSKPNAASLDRLASWFPIDRVLFGTGAPFYYWEGSRLGLEGSLLTEAQKRAILGANALAVFQWNA